MDNITEADMDSLCDYLAGREPFIPDEPDFYTRWILGVTSQYSQLGCNHEITSQHQEAM